MTSTDWLIFAAFWVVLIAIAVVWDHIVALHIDNAHLRRAYSEERRENAHLSNLLAVAEDVNSQPCQCGCDDERIGSDTPIFDQTLVTALYYDIEALERGEVL